MKPLTVTINESNIYSGAALGLLVLIGLAVISSMKKQTDTDLTHAIIA